MSFIPSILVMKVLLLFLKGFSLYDWETSSENISLIEGKLKRWHYEVDMLYDGETSVGNRISSLKSCEQIVSENISLDFVL